MTQKLLGLFLFGVLLSGGLAASGAGGEGDDMVENPRYKFWAKHKPGASSTYTQITKFQGPEKANLPGGADTKTITYKLISVNKDKAVVLTTVVEDDFLQTVESAPTKVTYPAKVKKADLHVFMREWEAKDTKEEMHKVGGKDIDCKVKSGAHKIEGGTVEAKIAYSPMVPGGVVMHTRTTKEGDKTVAETTTTLRKYSEGDGGKKEAGGK
jgi:hypothetical protein